MRWFLVLFILLLVMLSCMPALSRLGLGRLPGDLRFTAFGRRVELPFMSTIVLAVVAFLIARFIF